jgi:peptidyl-prolyl cis-trans isomerase B (cyclophilin B)
MIRHLLVILTLLAASCSLASAQQVKLATTMGDIIVEVDMQKAPVSSKNFLGYVRDGFYDGTIFHRVMDGFMIQGGGFTAAFEKKDSGDSIINEANNGLKNLRGTLAMARTGDPHSASAQFFINVVDNAFLDHTAQTSRGWGYAVFAKVTQGMDVVDRIKAVTTGNRRGHQNVPRADIIITTATVIGE